MKEEVISFYNHYAEQLIFQREIKHARYQFVEKLVRDTIQPHHTVLDLGCGIGTTSVIISAYCQEVVAVDFAPRLIELAEKRDNISYYCCDIANIHFKRIFDVICLFDVLEHIETTKLSIALEAITRHMTESTALLIILPYWKYLDYKKIHHADTIQIIDNSISLNNLIPFVQQHSLEIMHYEILNLFHICDYTYIEMKLDANYVPKKVR